MHTYIHQKTCTRIFAETLSAITKKWEMTKTSPITEHITAQGNSTQQWQWETVAVCGHGQISTLFWAEETRHRRAQHDGRSHVNTAQNRQKSTVVSESGWWLPPDGVGASEDRRVSERGSLSTFYNLEYQLHRYAQFWKFIQLHTYVTYAF